MVFFAPSVAWAGSLGGVWDLGGQKTISWDGHSVNPAESLRESAQSESYGINRYIEFADFCKEPI